MGKTFSASCALFVVLSAFAPHAKQSVHTTPVVVELFTSEGCSSCPAADALLQRLVDTQPVPGAFIVGLGHHVDYWDQLGWKDRFSSMAATNRQQRYGQVLNVDSIYTPQMIVDGHEEFVGSDAGRAGKAIASAIVAPHAIVSLGVTYNTETTEPTEKSKENNLNDLRGLCELCVVRVFVDVANLPKLSRGDRADVFVAVTESHLRSDVRGGENRGRTLSHAPVVRQIVTVGEAGAGALQTRLSLNTAWKREHLTMVAFVQERFSRRVLGAAAVPLSSAAK